MPNATMEYILTADGAIKRRSISEQEIDANTAVMDALSANKVIRVPSLFSIEGQPVHGSVARNDELYGTMLLPSLKLSCSMHISGKVATLDFESKDPPLAMEWTPPEGCRLAFMNHMNRSGRHWYSTTSWIFALDDRGSTYKLPLANVFDDAKICMGDFNSRAENVPSAMQIALDQFRNSKWNSDLMPGKEYTKAMFRWDVTNDGFTTLMPSVSWITVAHKVSVPMSKYLSLP